MIETGAKVPDVELWTMGTDGPVSVRSADLLGAGRTVLFAVPGAFTPGCSRTHLPGYVERGRELLANGIDRIICLSVNDAYVMHAWGQAHEVGDLITMAADGNGEFTREMGLELDGRARGLGVRSRRYSALVEDGRIARLQVDDPGVIEASTCRTMLELI